MAKKVLVVDDEKLIVKGIRFSLEQDGMEVDCAYDGEEALSMAKEKEYDMILLDLMLPKGLIVYTEDKNGKKTKMKSDEEHQFTKPLAVLVNGNSASASEIFAGAIKDYDYGTLIGTKTFGKGIVQTVFPLENGDAIKITTAKYYTPKGHYIHGKGIQPDIKLEYKYSGPEDESYDMKYDNQLQKAISVVKEKIN